MRGELPFQVFRLCVCANGWMCAYLLLRSVCADGMTPTSCSPCGALVDARDQVSGKQVCVCPWASKCACCCGKSPCRVQRVQWCSACSGAVVQLCSACSGAACAVVQRVQLCSACSCAARAVAQVRVGCSGAACAVVQHVQCSSAAAVPRGSMERSRVWAPLPHPPPAVLSGAWVPLCRVPCGPLLPSQRRLAQRHVQRHRRHHAGVQQRPVSRHPVRPHPVLPNHPAGVRHCCLRGVLPGLPKVLCAARHHRW